MPQTISPGRWRGLKTTSTVYHTFSILAFDQRDNYRKMLADPTDFALASQIKAEVVNILSSHVSAVLLDPIYGLKAALGMAGSSGLLMTLEKTGYSGDSTARRVEFIDGWDVAKIKQMGASAVKILIYYHPDAGDVAEEIERVIYEVAREAHQYDLPLFVEPLSYSLDPTIIKDSAAFAEQRPAIVRETARRLGTLGGDVLKLEFPIDVAFDADEIHWQAACSAISEVSPVPWVLLSGGVNFDTFTRQVEIACRSGASGFLGGRAIWKEAVTMNTTDREDFLRHTGINRLVRLMEIVNTHARPWTDFYAPIAPIEEWFIHYGGVYEPQNDH
ncbi:MAG: tagatose 1,6-diphosphate aldolase [Chloroflexi bacterium]|nr:tagatose 1,6-diphosphate aldolase [Chloroflexota bacterium]